MRPIARAVANALPARGSRILGRVVRVVTRAACVAVVWGQLAVTGAAAGGQELAQLRGISSRLDREFSAIVIETTEPVAYVASQPDPLTVLVDMRNVRASGVRLTTLVAPVTAVRVEQAASDDGTPIVRVRVNLAHAAPHRVRTARNLILIEVGRESVDASATLAAVAAPIAAAAGAVTRAAATELRAIRVSRTGDEATVSIFGNGVLKASTVEEVKEDPPRVLLDFEGVFSGPAVPAVLGVGQGDVSRVRVALNRRTPRVTRVVVDLKRNLKYRVEGEGNELRVIFGAVATVASVAPTIVDAPAASPATAVAAEAAPSSMPVEPAPSAPAPVDAPELAANALPTPTATPAANAAAAVQAPQTSVVLAAEPAVPKFTGRPASLDVQGAPLGIAQRPGLRIPRAGTAPLLSTFTGAEVPRGVGEVSGFLQREPQDGTPSAFDTKVYLSYDQERLYAVFVCRDEPAEVRARVTRREGSGSDDSVSLYLDTFHDRRRAYVFTSNPYGVQSEHIRTEGQDDDDSFDTLWYTEAAMTPFGYVVKMTIPFRSLRFSGAPSQSWGIALSRRIQRLTEESYWPLVSKRVQGLVPQFAVARGLEHISPGANIQLTPYGAFTGARVGPAAAGEVDTTWRGGLDAKVGLGSAFVLDAAVNPDFSEVESDEPQVTVNERFEVLFPEKRPFFLENAGYFGTPVPVFFSRRVLDPRAGARVTGKAGPWVTAGLAMQDRATPDRDAATAIVGTVRREVGGDGHVGTLGTLRRADTTTNAALSVDGRWTLGDTWAVAGQAIRTVTSQDGRQTSGTGLFADLSHDSRHLDFSAQYTDLSSDFDAALGFIRRVNIRQVDHKTAYRWRPRRGPVVKYGPTLDGFVVWDHTHALADWRIRPRFAVELVGQTSFLVDHARSFESLGGLGFDKRRSTVEVETEHSRWWGLSASYELGTDINRKPARGQLPHLVDRRSMEVEASFRPGRHLVFSQMYLRTQLRQLGDTGPNRDVLDNQNRALEGARAALADPFVTRNPRLRAGGIESCIQRRPGSAAGGSGLAWQF